MHSKVVLKSQEGAKYPLDNTGLGRDECFAGLGFLGLRFSGRSSKSWHEAGAVVLAEGPGVGEKGASFPGPCSCHALC